MGLDRSAKRLPRQQHCEGVRAHSRCGRPQTFPWPFNGGSFPRTARQAFDCSVLSPTLSWAPSRPSARPECRLQSKISLESRLVSGAALKSVEQCSQRYFSIARWCREESRRVSAAPVRGWGRVPNASVGQRWSSRQHLKQPWPLETRSTA